MLARQCDGCHSHLREQCKKRFVQVTKSGAFRYVFCVDGSVFLVD